MTRDEMIAYPLFLLVMTGLVAYSVIVLLMKMATSWNAFYMVVFSALAALEAYGSYFYFRNDLRRLSGTTKYRVVEVVGWFFLLELVINFSKGQPLLSNIPNFGAEFMVGAFVMIVFWFMGFLTARDLKEMSEPPSHEAGVHFTPNERISVRVLGGGVILLAATALTRIQLLNVFDLNGPSVPGVIFSGLLYFLLGAVMLAKVNYETLSAQWQDQRVRLVSGLSNQWVLYTAAFILLAGIIALVLPTGYTTGLWSTISLVAGFLFSIIAWIGKWLLFPLLWLISLFSSNNSDQAKPQPPKLNVMPNLPKNHSNGLDLGAWLGIIKSVVFWAIIVAVAIYLVRAYLHNNPAIMRAIRSFAPVRFLRGLWAAIWLQLRGYAGMINEHIPKQMPTLRRPRRAERGGSRFVRRSGDTPREQVMRYYLSVLQRAGRQGYPRQRNQTPQEYNATLGPNLRDAGEDMDSLTRLFVEARYSRHDVGADDAGQGRSYWSRITSALKSLQRRATGKDEG